MTDKTNKSRHFCRLVGRDHEQVYKGAQEDAGLGVSSQFKLVLWGVRGGEFIGSVRLYKTYKPQKEGREQDLAQRNSYWNGCYLSVDFLSTYPVLGAGDTVLSMGDSCGVAEMLGKSPALLR